MRFVIGIVLLGLTGFTAWVVCEIGRLLMDYQDPFSTEWFVAEEERSKNEQA